MDWRWIAGGTCSSPTPSLGHVFVMQPNGECIARIKSCAGSTCTNVALTSTQAALVITESSTGSILTAQLDT